MNTLELTTQQEMADKLTLGYLNEHTKMLLADREAFEDRLHKVARHGRMGAGKLAALQTIEALSLSRSGW